jgi:hypothetical protein
MKQAHVAKYCNQRLPTYGTNACLVVCVGVTTQRRRKDQHNLDTVLSPFEIIIVFLQEKVEEDRFMREQEKVFFEKKRKAMAQKMHAEEEAIFKEKIAPAMAEAQHVLKKAGGVSVGDDALEALAKWKLDM